MKRFIVAITVLVFAFASLSVAKPAKAKAGPKPARTAAKAVKKSEVKDARDGQVYRVVNIAGLTWMGDNLNYNAEGSFCLDDDENNCMAYGRRYTGAVPQKRGPPGFRGRRERENPPGAVPRPLPPGRRRSVRPATPAV